jgi:hypothetical protein
MIVTPVSFRTLSKTVFLLGKIKKGASKMEKVKLFNPYKMYIGLFIPNFIAKNPNLSHLSKLCYGRLLQYSGKHGYCYPKQETLAEELASSVRSTERALAELIESNLIYVKHPTGKDRLIHAPNKYYFIKPKDIEVDPSLDDLDDDGPVSSDGSGERNNDVCKGRESLEVESGFINKTITEDFPNLHSKAKKIREACKRRKQVLPETEESILDNLDPNITRIFEHWIESGLVKHKVGNKTFLSIVHKLELAFSGKLFRGVEGFEKYATKKFMRKDVLDAITAHANSAFSLEYEPATQKSKEYLQKMSFDLFLYNPNGSDRKHQSFFIHYLENGAKKVSEAAVKKIATKDTHPDITKMLTDWYSSFVMKGNNGHYSPSEMRTFITSSERIFNFDHSKIYAMNNLKFTLRCSEPHEVVAKLLLKMLEEQIEDRDAKVTPSWLASDITFNESFPKFLRERNYISEKRY